MKTFFALLTFVLVVGRIVLAFYMIHVANRSAVGADETLTVDATTIRAVMCIDLFLFGSILGALT